jgi:hypothetical protein
MAEKKIPLDVLYKKMPPSFRSSAATMYRILGYIKEGITRRMGTALILTPYNNDKKVLVASDISTPRIELGKPYGSISIPMGFSRKRDPREDAILRVLQQEVFTKLAVDGKLPNIIPNRPKPFMYLDVADVRVEIFHIRLPRKYVSTKVFSSYKLKDYKFQNISGLTKMKSNNNLRAGVYEALNGYKKNQTLLKRNLSFNPLQQKSELNYYLAKD